MKFVLKSGPLLLGKIGARVACSQVIPSKYHPEPVSQPVHVRYVLVQSRQLAIEQVTTNPVPKFGPFVLGMTGAIVACSQVVPSKYHPEPVSQPVHVRYVLLQSRQLAMEQVTTNPVPVLGPLVLGMTGAIVACSQMVPSKYHPVPVSQLVQAA